MDTTIIAAIITSIGTIIAALIMFRAQSKYRDVQRNDTLPENVPDTKKERHSLNAKGVIDKDFVLGVSFIIACSILYGASHVISKKVISDFHDPIVIATIRNFISGLMIIGVGVILSNFSKKKQSKIEWDRDSFYMVLGRGMNSIFYFSSFLFMSATMTITLHKFDPVFTMLILIFILKSRVSDLSFTNIIFGLIVSILGSILAVSGAMEYPPVIESLWGIPIVLLAGLSWSIFIVASERHASTSKHQTELWERQLFVGKTYVLSAIPATIWVIVKLSLQESYSLSFSVEQFLWIILLSVLAAAIGVLYFEALKRISSLLVGILISLEIFFTMIFESIWLGSSLHWNLFIGAILVLIGAFSIGRESKKLKI